MGSPRERPLRLLFSAVLAALPLSGRLPGRSRGLLWLLVGAGPTFGAFAGGAVPIARGAALMRSAGEVD